LVLAILAALALGGCSTAAAPCRVAGAGVKVVPIIGDIVGAAFDTCGDVID
jgi:hypothetical protein